MLERIKNYIVKNSDGIIGCAFWGVLLICCHKVGYGKGFKDGVEYRDNSSMWYKG